MQNNSFALNRTLLLFKSDLILNKATIFTAIATILGILFLYNIIAPQNITEINYDPAGFIAILFFGGIWVASSAFRDLHNPKKSYFFLTLPCSTLEKFIEKLFITTIFYSIAALALYTLFYWIIATFYFLVIQKNYFSTIIFDLRTWHLILSFIVIQSIFLLSSAYFKKHVILKTILTLSCLGIILSILTSSSFYLFFHNAFTFDTFLAPNFAAINPLARAIFYAIEILIAPICWIVTYFRIKEIEV